MNIDYKLLDPETPASQVYGLQSCGFLKPVKDCDDHTHNYNEFFLVRSGALTHIVNGAEQKVSEMQLCFVRKNDVHSMTTVGLARAADFYNIGIPDRLFERAAAFFDADLAPFIDAELPTVVSLSTTEYKALARKIDKFQSTPYGEYHGQLFMSILSDFIYFLLKPKTKAAMPVAKDTPQWFYNLLDSMQSEENFIEGISRMRELSNYSQEHINRMFKKYMEITPTEYINTLRVVYARKLIVEENCDIMDACYRSGFKTAGYFYRIFKQYYGMSPIALKKHENSLI